MESLINSFTDKLGEYLPGVIPILIILIAGIFISKVIHRLCEKVLNSIKVGKAPITEASRITLVKLVSNLAYYVCVLFVLLFVLERMGVSSVLDPLNNMLDQMVGYIPNVIAAGIIFYAGWTIAKIVSSLTEVALVKVDDYLVKKDFDLQFKVSKFLSAFLFGGILIPIYIVGFETLKISAISDPAIEMLSGLANAVPNIVGAAMILLVAYFIGRFVTFLLSGLLEGLNLNELPKKLGFSDAMSGLPLVTLVSKALMFFIMLGAATMALEVLQFDLISELFAQMMSFGGNIILGLVILSVGNFLATIAYKKMSAKPDNAFVAGIARFAILGLVLALGLKEMGLGDEIINMAFGLTLGSVAVAVALSFGLGGREAAGKSMGELLSKLKK